MKRTCTGYTVLNDSLASVYGPEGATGEEYFNPSCCNVLGPFQNPDPVNMPDFNFGLINNFDVSVSWTQLVL